MKYKNILTQIIVGATLIGFIACAIYVFWYAFDNPQPNTDITKGSLKHILSGLTGLIGGFVAASFGITSKGTEESKNSNRTLKLMNLGSFVTDNTNPKKQEILGFIFALSYIIIGITSIVIWVILDDKTIQSVSKMATTFFGISIPIVAGFLKPV